MAQGDYYNVRVQGQYAGQGWENVYWVYQGSAGSVSNITTSLVSWFNTNIYDAIKGVCHEDWTVGQITVQNWRNVSQADAAESTVVGQVATAGMPTWLNYTISFNRFGAGYNYGMKRINGVPEANTDGNDVASGTVTTLSGAFDNLFSISVTGGASLGFMVVGNPPPIGTDNILQAQYRVQFPNAIRAVNLGTQKTRK